MVRVVINYLQIGSLSIFSVCGTSVTMTVKVYKLDPSPPARAVMMACDIFNVPAELIDLNLFEKEHLSPAYLKKNPLHTVPTLEDGDLFIQDSHAALQYLAGTYGKDDSWYPKDLKARALVDQKLFFDTGYLFPRIRNISYPAVIEGERKVPQKKWDDIREAYDFLEVFLTKTKFLATDHITIADIAAFASVTCLVALVPLDAKKYPKTSAWLKEMESKPYAKKYNEAGAKQFSDLIKEKVDFPQ